MDIRILVVEDDAHICELLRVYLESEGFSVIIANDGETGFNYFKIFEPDLVLLDIMLPNMNGWDVCKQIRQISTKPIIMITAKGEVFDKVLGLELGADDFMVKPLDMKELSARVKAVLRRFNYEIATVDPREILRFDRIELSLEKYEMKIDGQVVDIPPRELALLYFLASHPNRVFNRNHLLDQVWGFDYIGDTRTVDVHIKRLRERLDGVSDKWALRTVWGVGYKFELK